MAFVWANKEKCDASFHDQNTNKKAIRKNIFFYTLRGRSVMNEVFITKEFD